MIMFVWVFGCSNELVNTGMVFDSSVWVREVVVELRCDFWKCVYTIVIVFVIWV